MADPAPQRARIARCLADFDFRRLFIEELGWNKYDGKMMVEANGASYALAGVAEKRGLVVLRCAPDARGSVPNSDTRKRIEAAVNKSMHEHLLIFTDAGQTQQHWLWVKRQAGQPTRYRGEQYFMGQTGERLLQKLQQIAVDIADEESITLLDVVLRLEQGWNVEKVTKKFYDGFQAQHRQFMAAIQGIADDEQRAWYASLMLNRLMFTYFIQKKGFLDGNVNYLTDRLARVRQALGPNRFLSFYQSFLLVFFHDGLGKPDAARGLAEPLKSLIGRVPYLNGGLFEVHQIEAGNHGIAIEDAAFKRLFAFFDEYQWHLDDRPLRADNEINPDVLGYIFEKYINQKQMGAYYTKEDITGYISRSTVLPWLLDQVREQCRVAFEPEGEVWRLLRDDPDRYLYEAVRHGVDEPLPADIAAGIGDVARRGGWNRPAPESHALPTETWREHVARRQRCQDLSAKLVAGEVHEVNDLITYNLDIARFTQDVIERCEGPEVVRAFWQALTSVTVLDPTCGSGAFLFAALNLLEPLYAACLDRMQALRAAFERAGEPRKGTDFQQVLERVGSHPNRRYYILKSIIIQNLYGVDIMAEACEIAKLRLFLKLVAQVESAGKLEPLPDIDFNIRAGNTLVGFATFDEAKRAISSTLDFTNVANEVEQQAVGLSELAQAFRDQQTKHGGRITPEDKAELRGKLLELDDILDRYLAARYGIDAHHFRDQGQLAANYAAWKDSHKPFHWFVEFYGIIEGRGGFDVIIGNPPYVDLRTLTEYSVKGLATVATRNLYAPMMERSLAISRSEGKLGFIVPVSSISTEGYKALQDVIFRYPIHVSSYDDRPSRLFDGLEHIRLSIHLIQNCAHMPGSHYTTECYRWNAEERTTLFSRLRYQSVESDYLACSLPKISSALELSVLTKVWQNPAAIGHQERRLGSGHVYFSRKLSSFLQVLDFIPKVYDGTGKLRPPSEFKELRFDPPESAEAAFCLFNSTLFRWYMNVFSDFRHVNKREIEGFRMDLAASNSASKGAWHLLSAQLSQNLQSTSEFRQMKFSHDTLRVQCILPKYSKAIIDDIDRVLAQHYGFTDEELDFIINYDIKYRMGQDGADADVADEDA